MLSRPEELILLSVWRLQGKAYGMSIRQLLVETTGQSWSIGAVYVPLDKLVKRQLVKAELAPSTQARGGRQKRMFTLTDTGISALTTAHEIHQAMWTNLPVLKPRLV